MTDPLDPHDLVANGEALATSTELAKLFGVSRRVLEAVLRVELRGRVRYTRPAPSGGKWRYAVADAKAAIAPLLPRLEQARRLADERQAKDEAEAAKRRAERKAASAAPLAVKPKQKQKLAPALAPKPRVPSTGPEVFVRRRPSA